MNEYELTILTPEELTVVDKIALEKQIKRYGRITKRLVDGVKRLAYPIMNREKALYLYYKALYLYYELEMESGKPAELSSHLTIQDNVVRFLIVKKDTRGGNR